MELGEEGHKTHSSPNRYTRTFLGIKYYTSVCNNSLLSLNPTSSFKKLKNISTQRILTINQNILSKINAFLLYSWHTKEKQQHFR